MRGRGAWREGRRAAERALQRRQHRLTAFAGAIQHGGYDSMGVHAPVGADAAGNLTTYSEVAQRSVRGVVRRRPCPFVEKRESPCGRKGGRMRSIRLQVSLLAFAVVLPFLVAACGGSPSTLAPQPSGSTGRPTASEPGQTASSDAEWERIVARAKQEGSVTFYGSVVLQGARGAKIAQSFEQEYG